MAKQGCEYFSPAHELTFQSMNCSCSHGQEVWALFVNNFHLQTCVCFQQRQEPLQREFRSKNCDIAFINCISQSLYMLSMDFPSLGIFPVSGPQVENHWYGLRIKGAIFVSVLYLTTAAWMALQSLGHSGSLPLAHVFLCNKWLLKPLPYGKI